MTAAAQASNLSHASSPGNFSSVNSGYSSQKSSAHWVLNGLARIFASRAPEIVRFEDSAHAPATNLDMRSPDQYWFKQSCKTFAGFMCSEIRVHGVPPQPGETVIEYSNHRGYADGAIVVLAQNPPPLQIAVRHDPADSNSLMGKAIESMVNPILDFAGCLTVSKPKLLNADTPEKKGDGAVAKIVEHLSEPGQRFWAAAEGAIGDAKDEGRVSVSRIRTGVTVAGLQSQAGQGSGTRAQPYALAIGNGSNACIQYAIARLGAMAGLATGASMVLGSLLGMYFSKSDTTRTALPLLGLASYAFAKRGIDKTVDKLVPNKADVLAHKPVVHVQWRRFDLPEVTVPPSDQQPGHQEWEAAIAAGKKTIEKEINLAQSQLAVWGQ